MRRALILACVALCAAASAARAGFADSLSGGPDLWEVSGVPAGDTLSLRRSPSTRAPVVGKAANGEVLRNKGCRIVSTRRWCLVGTLGTPALSGWVAGRYLREASGSAQPLQDSDPAALCRRFAAVDLLTDPRAIRLGAVTTSAEGTKVEASADLGSKGHRTFACTFGPTGQFLGLVPRGAQ